MAWTSVTGVDQRGRWRLRRVGGGRTRVEFRFAYGVAGGGTVGWLAEMVAAPTLSRAPADARCSSSSARSSTSSCARKPPGASASASSPMAEPLARDTGDRREASAAVTIRAAEPGDDAELAALDHRAWIRLSSPAGRPPADQSFFSDEEDHKRVLVAERPGELVGWVRIRPPTSLESNAHVREVAGLAVHPDARRLGIVAALMGAAEAAARSDGATRIRLRVFAPNEAARALYESLGYAVDGILPGEFIIDGAAVDDVLMGKALG